MGAKERVGHAMDRAFDRLRHRSAFEVDPSAAVGGGFDALRGSRYGLLVTFRRSGEPVPSPVWVAVDEEGRAFVRTGQDAAKVRRIRHDPAVLLAPASGRGRPTGSAIRGTARVLPQGEWDHAERTLVGAYGVGRKVYQRIVGDPEGVSTYLEIVPAGAARPEVG